MEKISYQERYNTPEHGANRDIRGRGYDKHVQAHGWGNGTYFKHIGLNPMARTRGKIIGMVITMAAKGSMIQPSKI